MQWCFLKYATFKYHKGIQMHGMYCTYESIFICKCISTLSFSDTIIAQWIKLTPIRYSQIAMIKIMAGAVTFNRTIVISMNREVKRWI